MPWPARKGATPSRTILCFTAGAVELAADATSAPYEENDEKRTFYYRRGEEVKSRKPLPHLCIVIPTCERSERGGICSFVRATRAGKADSSRLKPFGMTDSSINARPHRTTPEISGTPRRDDCILPSPRR